MVVYETLLFLTRAVAAVCLVIWLYLFFARGFFWRIKPARSLRRDGAGPLPPVAVIVPARNEAAHIGKSIASLLDQDYTGPFQIIVVDDHSTDGTADIARSIPGADGRVTVIDAPELPAGWTGKLWALSTGVNAALASGPLFLLFTDADVVHSSHSIRKLVIRAETRRLDLASLMVRLHSKSFPEKLLIPAFVYFFFKLYPPAWVSRTRRRTAAAAGGCLLVRAAALDRIGGLSAIRGELIDDCALAGALKRHRSHIWIGLTSHTRSIRPYNSLGEIGRMIARTAYAQLRYSPTMLALTLAGMIVTYLAPLLLLATGDPWTTGVALAAFALMSFSYVPALRFYSCSLLFAPLLPVAAAFYMGATILSAVRYHQGRGGEWKGRAQAHRES